VLRIDYREGSKQLAVALERAGLPVYRDAHGALDQLPAGPKGCSADVRFQGRGDNGEPIEIGIEHKTVEDLVQSLRTNRLNNQAHDMRMLYRWSWLVVEGPLVYNAKGMLMRRSGVQSFKPMGMQVDEMFKRVTVLHLCGGLNPVWFPTRRDTVRWIGALYHALTDKDLDDHTSHLGLYQPAAAMHVSQFRQTMQTLPGVGAQVAQAAERKWGKIVRAVNAPILDWCELTTVARDGKKRKVGYSTAQKLLEALGRA
jgi:ERCC4-type nuclease